MLSYTVPQVCTVCTVMFQIRLWRSREILHHRHCWSEWSMWSGSQKFCHIAAPIPPRWPHMVLHHTGLHTTVQQGTRWVLHMTIRITAAITNTLLPILWATMISAGHHMTTITATTTNFWLGSETIHLCMVVSRDQFEPSLFCNLPEMCELCGLEMLNTCAFGVGLKEAKPPYSAETYLSD